MRRDLTLSLALLAALLALVPAFSPVFVDGAWRVPLLAAGALAVLLAAAVRRVHGGPVAAAAVSLVGLAVLTYLLHLPNVGLLPTSESWGDATALLRQGLADLRDQPAPTVTAPGLAMLLSTGAWIVMHLAHELAVRWRRVGLALVPITLLWTAPLAVPLPDAAAWPRALPFLAGAVLLLLLGADDDVERGQTERAPRLTSSGVVVGASALAVAVLFPWLLPGYGAQAWVDLGGGVEPRGYQPIVDVSERLQLPTERDVLRVWSSERTYLRLAGLDSFDGFTWRLGPPGEGSYQPSSDALHRTDGELPPEEFARSVTPVVADVEVLDLANIYVPSPYQPLRVLGPQRDEMVWSTEGGFLATWQVEEDRAGALEGTPRVGVQQGFTYRIEAARPSPDIEQLRQVVVDDATRQRWTQLPRAYPRLGEIAREVFAAAGAETDIDRALALQDWFAADGGFTYDLAVPPLRGDDALERFVLEDRVGYCEYFATAMAVMLREVGIPARVALGFLPGRVTQDADPDAGRELTEFTVATSDAHAWVEVLFPGFGWLTLEPTPRDDSTQLLPRVENLAPTENERERRARERREQLEAEASPTEPEEAEPPTDDTPPLAEEPAPGTGAGTGTDDRGVPWPLLLLGLVGVAVAAGTAARFRRRHVPAGASPADRVLHAQRELLHTADRYGIGRRPAETTPELVRRWHTEGRVDAGSRRFAAVAQAAAFGGDIDGTTAAEAEELVRDLETLLRDSVPRRDRALAPLRRPHDLARSLLGRLAGLVARIIGR